MPYWKQFPREKLPNRDKTIKRKLWQGLTPEVKSRLEGFLEEDYPLHRFIDRVEHERQWLEAIKVTLVYRVKNELPKTSETTQGNNLIPTEATKSNATSSEPSVVKPTEEQVGRLQVPARSPRFERYCTYCRSTTHCLRECGHKPPRGIASIVGKRDAGEGRTVVQAPPPSVPD